VLPGLAPLLAGRLVAVLAGVAPLLAVCLVAVLAGVARLLAVCLGGVLAGVVRVPGALVPAVAVGLGGAGARHRQQRGGDGHHDPIHLSPFRVTGARQWGSRRQVGTSPPWPARQPRPSNTICQTEPALVSTGPLFSPGPAGRAPPARRQA